MPYELSPDVQQLVRERMASGHYSSEEALLKEALLALAEQEEDLIAVQQALAEWEGGDAGIPLNEAFDLIRSRHVAKPGP
jgi:Arc/MetJ-type ribon-helix-helix transcriptional regulator